MGNPAKFTSFTLDEMEEIGDEFDKVGSGKFEKMSAGKNRYRFLPGVDGKKPIVVVWTHYVTDPSGSKKVFVCVKMHTKNKKRCRVCEASSVMQKSGNAVDRKTGEDMRAKLQLYANVINRAREDDGPKVLRFGKMIYDDLQVIMEDEGDIFDPGPDGFDIVIRKSGKDRRTEYKTTPSKNCSLGIDEDLWIDDLHNLDKELEFPDEGDVLEAIEEYLPRGVGRGARRSLASGGRVVDVEATELPKRLRGPTAQDDIEDDEDEDDIPF